MKKIISFLALFVFIVNSSATPPPPEEKTYKSVNDISVEDQTKLKAPLLNLFQTTDFSIFLKEFEMNFDMGICGTSYNAALGFKTHMIEPIGYMETTKKPLKFPFANLDLNGNILKSCSSRAGSKEESARDECYYNHFIFAPIMGMIFKKKLKMLCFHQGSVALPLLSEFDPSHLNDSFNYKTIPHMIAMVSPQAILSTALDCLATTSVSAIRGYSTGSKGSGGTFAPDAWAEQYENPEQRETHSTSTNVLKDKGIQNLDYIRNSMYYNVGCQGLFPVGGYSEGIDPGIDAGLLAFSAMSKLHGFSAVSQIPLLQKQTEFSMEISDEIDTTSPGSTWCKPKDFLMPIKAQYIIQLSGIPTTGGGKEQGESGMMLTSFTNVSGGNDSYVYIYWQRRDYLAGAYACYDKPMDASNSN